MNDLTDKHVRWEPLPNLPEHPFGTLDLTFNDLELVATPIYAFDAPVRGLRADFGGVEAFKVYEEFSDPWMELKPSQPMVDNSTLNPWVWPLQEIENSSWLARVIARNGGAMEDLPWRHLIVVTGTITLHVMTYEPEVTLLHGLAA